MRRQAGAQKITIDKCVSLWQPPGASPIIDWASAWLSPSQSIKSIRLNPVTVIDITYNTSCYSWDLFSKYNSQWDAQSLAEYKMFSISIHFFLLLLPTLNWRHSHWVTSSAYILPCTQSSDAKSCDINWCVIWIFLTIIQFVTTCFANRRNCFETLMRVTSCSRQNRIN